MTDEDLKTVYAWIGGADDNEIRRFATWYEPPPDVRGIGTWHAACVSDRVTDEPVYHVTARTPSDAVRGVANAITTAWVVTEPTPPPRRRLTAVPSRTPTRDDLIRAFDTGRKIGADIPDNVPTADGIESPRAWRERIRPSEPEPDAGS